VRGFGCGALLADPVRRAAHGNPSFCAAAALRGELPWGQSCCEYRTAVMYSVQNPICRAWGV
jgi:hypothetical protein